MGPPPTVPARTSPAQSGLAPQFQRQAQESPRQIEPRPHQKHVRSTIIQPEREPRQSHVAEAKSAPATTSTMARYGILAALAGSSPISAPSPLLPTDTLLQTESSVQVPPAQLVQQQPQRPVSPTLPNVPFNYRRNYPSPILLTETIRSTMTSLESYWVTHLNRIAALASVHRLRTLAPCLYQGRVHSLLPRGIKVGVTRPTRNVPFPHADKVGVKRSAEEAFASGKAAITAVPGVGGKADWPVFGELEVGSDGAVLKRVRR